MLTIRMEDQIDLIKDMGWMVGGLLFFLSIGHIPLTRYVNMEFNEWDELIGKLVPVSKGKLNHLIINRMQEKMKPI